MRPINKLLLLLTGLVLFLAACDKVKDLPYYNKGTAVTLTASSTAIAPTAADSANQVVTFSWSNPEYATDSSNQKFILEIDSAGRNFSHRVTKEVTGVRNISFTGQELNNLLAGFGFAAGQKFSFDIRVISSYANNNERLNSNVIKVDISSYKVPVKLNASSTAPIVLQVNNATNTAVSFNWNASPYGSNTIYYALHIDTAGGNFANPQVKQLGTALNTSFTVNELNAAAIAAGVIGGSTKNLEFRVASYLGTNYTNLFGYSDVVTINVTTFTPIPATLYIVGDATPGGWDNPVPVPSQQFSRIDDVSYGIVVSLEAGKSYLFLPVNGDWGHKYGGASATGGTLLADGAVPGSNTPAPAASGMYQIIVNFQTGKYTVTPYDGSVPLPVNLYIVGDATAGEWNNPVPLPSQQFARVNLTEFQLTIPLTGGKSYLFLPVNGNWDHKYGGSNAAGGTLLVDGAVPGSNTPAPAESGTYLINVNFSTMKYTVTKK